MDAVELTGIVDIATRTLAAAVLRPSTKAVDAALLLARAMTPEPMRPGWADALRMSRSVLPHTSLMALDKRLAHAAAVPVITPETIVCDRGKAYVSDTFRSACQSLGISFQPTHPDTPTDKPHIETTLGSVATMFVQHLPGHKGRSTEHRGTDPASEAFWTIHRLQEPRQEWIVHWQNRPHDGLCDPLMPGKALSPNEKYAALVAAAGHVPVALGPQEYIELLPRCRRRINSYGIRLGHRTYDSAELNPFRRQPSGAGPDGRSREVHYDPYDISRIWVRNHREGGWSTAIWPHLRTAPTPMGEPARDHARRILAQRGTDPVTEDEIAEAAVALLDRAADGPEDKPAKPSRASRRGRKVAARTRATAEPSWPRPRPEEPAEEPITEPVETDEDELRRRDPTGDLRRTPGGRTVVVNAPEPDGGEVPEPGGDRTDPSTRLEGWRRFVEEDPAVFDLLPEQQWQALSPPMRDAYDEAASPTTPNSKSCARPRSRTSPTRDGS
ncbi:Mu transposase C-terminal domain-containing protein [Streptomyces europaeiscabiei]|uniref:Mu transposase C-terminal domain-containing protein n=1 Tax=Streptomyces europaeiscabiei TaxID=146819 RepID=UPI0029AAF003|nr:Mu transposase C-terminal domain-containing protein [Streptomyces europaeiscabiei]MDX3584503.1 Mu transposase C-terminal domain-containing protein [Streptomyces europaeiscabiei]MDX3616724.1 Mu transposase C-terminal domain-containing protein [Streptomyces europaeiscabiei]